MQTADVTLPKTMLRNKVTAAILIGLLLSPYLTPIMWTDWSRLDHLESPKTTSPQTTKPKRDIYLLPNPMSTCSWEELSIQQSHIVWPSSIPCGSTIKLQYLLRDKNNKSLCYNTPILFAFAKSIPEEWVATSTVGFRSDNMEIRFPDKCNPSTILVTVLLAFRNMTLERGNPNTPECLYSLLGEKHYSYTCESNNVSQLSTTNSLHYYWKYSGNPTKKWLLNRFNSVQQPTVEVSNQSWVMFWGDGQLQVTYRNIIKNLTNEKINPFPGDRKSKHYFSREISHEIRKYDTNITNIRLSFFANHIADPSGKRSKNPCSGLSSLNNNNYKHRLDEFTSSNRNSSDYNKKILIIHSGVADLCNSYNLNTEALRNNAYQSALYWKTMFQPTHVILLTTVATSGVGVCHRFHASRLIWWDSARISEMRRVFPDAVIFDQFTLTSPFHLNNDFSDGTSYGIENINGRREVQLKDFPKISRFLAGKRYDPSVGIALGDELMRIGTQL